MAQKRRRGKALENDILTATLDLIESTKYEDITMDMIAKNAHTNKSVLYRRWESKAAIILAALRTQMGNVNLEVPDTGSIHDDLLALFDQLIDLLTKMNYDHLAGLMMERLGGMSVADFFKRLGPNNYVTQLMQQVMAQGQARGEIDLTAVDEQLLNLPVYLIMDTLFSKETALNQERMHWMVDSVMMPVLKPYLKK
ncbi:TetR/AcrR family transcriptional regulator [Lactobacillus sp. LC28-10]|uniref:TetR/AcrR family transcriptional regulator n=1 Tax=Secundilactobacillus angelensis TaxID=2722706 RepID=A0ABX1KXY6_9LACO|nr:TetR/AcrR family transcriptional regulator [Secundilactobacillus angelensis]MCH5461698.1 TetR/AcrR family transcriptional regulator [Secundilactobacillus angelensis]NLR17994.1 TetR/AcrR family transcriptional regulator [Secundilactobacillus angelensis]